MMLDVGADAGEIAGEGKGDYVAYSAVCTCVTQKFADSRLAGYAMRIKATSQDSEAEAEAQFRSAQFP